MPRPPRSTISGNHTLAATVVAPSLGPVPTKIGRFAVIGKLGAGGMGTVYSAYDDTLDRRVAVKVVSGEFIVAATRERIQREARAMAQLSHPNVVQVYEAGEYTGGMFVAMEYVKGETLGDWAATTPRSWQEILATYVQAGRGLAAAHRADLVHRDFKPDNAMIGVDGRVRVLDFGLVRQQGDAAAHPRGDVDVSEGQLPTSDHTASQSLTRTGKLLGTPRYMAPEQFRGETADARTDQFSFCVALYDALYGQRPFQGDSIWSLMVAVTTTPSAPVPGKSPVPARIGAALTRGLSAEPSDRFASLDELLTALAIDPHARRRRWVWAGAGIAALVAGISWQQSSRPKRVDVCADAQHALDDAWQPTERDRVRSSILLTQAEGAAEVAERVMADLDEYAQQWTAGRVQACTAARTEHTQPQSIMLARYRCLEGRKRDLRAATKVLRQLDTASLTHAQNVVSGMRSIERCAQSHYVLAQVEPPDSRQVEAVVERLRDRIAEVSALDRAGRYEQALASAEEVTHQARALAYDPIKAEALAQLGHAHLQYEHLKRAAGLFEDAYFINLRTGDGTGLTEAATSLVDVRDALADFPAALLWGRAAQAHIDSFGLDDTFQIRLLHYMGRVYRSQARYKLALAQFERALAISEADPRTPPSTLVATLSAVAETLQSLGKLEQAHTYYERAHTLNLEDHDPDHPLVAGTLAGLADVLAEQGQLAEAHSRYEQVLAIDRKTWGGDHPNVAATLVQLASVLVDRGQASRALDLIRQAQAIDENTRGRDHLDVAGTLNTKAVILVELGRNDEALAASTRALAITEQALGPGHPEVGISLLGHARALVATGDRDQAVVALERALRVFEHGEQDVGVQAEARFELAQALWATPPTRGRAVRLARQALTALASMGPQSADEVRSIRAWLAGHGADSATADL